MKPQRPEKDASGRLASLIAAKDVKALEELLAGCAITSAVLLHAVGILARSDNSMRQRSAANARHASVQKAKQWVNAHCETHRVRFPSKIKYAREASALVYVRFGVEVKPQTIARDWLPAGVCFGPEGGRRRGDAIAYVDGHFKPKRAGTLGLKR